MPALIEPKAALALADTLLSSFHEVEKLTAETRYDSPRVAVLLAGARDALEDAMKFEFPMHAAGDETNLSSSWINMLMVRGIGLLSRYKGEQLAVDGEVPGTTQLFLGLLIELNSLLRSPTLREPLERYFQERESGPAEARS